MREGRENRAQVKPQAKQAEKSGSYLTQKVGPGTGCCPEDANWHVGVMVNPVRVRHVPTFPPWSWRTFQYILFLPLFYE